MSLTFHKKIVIIVLSTRSKTSKMLEFFSPLKFSNSFQSIYIVHVRSLGSGEDRRFPHVLTALVIFYSERMLIRKIKGREGIYNK